MQNPDVNYKLLASIIHSTNHLDTILLAEFLSSSIKASRAHLDLIKKIIPENEQIRQERRICNASMLLTLIRFANMPREV